MKIKLTLTIETEQNGSIAEAKYKAIKEFERRSHEAKLTVGDKECEKKVTVKF